MTEETKEPTQKVQRFKQYATKTFAAYEEAKSYAEGLTAGAGEKIRVKYRRSRKEYDVVSFRQ